jgi:uncharacterized protein YcnI
MQMSPTLARRAATAALGLALALAVPAVAGAHVTVSSPDAAKGGYGKLVFRVPNESRTASTVKLVITLPKDTPIPSIRAKSKPGWFSTVTEEKLAQPVQADGATLTRAPVTVTFTAAPGVAIGPGQFDEFELSGGPFPSSVDHLSLPAVQCYSNGTEVRWDQPTPADGTEPAHPAPVLELAAATGDGHAGAATPTPTPTATAAAVEEPEPETQDALARGLGIVSLVAALVAAGFGLVAIRRGRTPNGPTGG